eukprot:10993656-Alexandrium_andersonii.AAC.1
MSASLVGSEMCIRDRTHSLVSGKLRSEPLPFPRTGNSLATAAWDDAPAVSYTHLTLPTICSV